MGDLLSSPASAVFSGDRTHRFELWRRWGPGGFCMFIGLNPSTADETVDDPTVRRCVGYAQSWGYDALCMTNLFSIRATDPKVMKGCPAPNLVQNDETLIGLARRAGIVIAAWGANDGHLRRDVVVSQMLDHIPVYCLALTKTGYPKHPLYLRKDLIPIPCNTLARSRRGHNPAPAT